MFIEYITLAISIVLFSFQSIFLKAYQGEAGHKTRQSILLMLISNVLIALAFLAVNRFQLNISLYTVIFGLMFAIINIGTNMSLLKAIGSGSVAIATLFLLLGSVILPFIYGVFFLNEKLSAVKLAAVFILCLSFIPLVFEEKIKRISSWKFFLFCVLAFCGNGLVSIIQKMQQLYTNSCEIIEFMIFTSICTAVISAFIILTALISNGGDFKLFISAKSIAATICYGLCNGIGNIALLYSLSMEKIPVSIQFPLISGGVAALTTVLALLIYRDKLSRYRSACLLLGIISIVLLTV